MQKELSKMVSSPESWYPSYPGGMVEVRLFKLRTLEWRVCVWGADDFGMDRDFPTRGEAFPYYQEIKDGVTRAYLESQGFARF